MLEWFFDDRLGGRNKDVLLDSVRLGVCKTDTLAVVRWKCDRRDRMNDHRIIHRVLSVQIQSLVD